MHQRADDLVDKLWMINESRKEEAIEEKNIIVNTSYVNHEINRIMILIQRLLRIEIDRHLGSIVLIHDSCNCIDNKPINDAPPIKYDLYPEISGENPICVEKEDDIGYKFPRLQKLVEKSWNIALSKYDEIDDDLTTKKQPAKKDDKKVTDKKDDFQKDEDETLATNFMQKSVNQEKNILKYKIAIIAKFADTIMNNIKNKSQDLFEKFDIWILHINKAENDAVICLHKSITDTIEREKKLK